jgi:hypothetical protein
LSVAVGGAARELGTVSPKFPDCRVPEIPGIAVS